MPRRRDGSIGPPSRKRPPSRFPSASPTCPTGLEIGAGGAVFIVAVHNSCCIASSHSGAPRDFISVGRDPGSNHDLGPPNGQIPCITCCSRWESRDRAGTVRGSPPPRRPAGPRCCDAQQEVKFWLVGDCLVLYISVVEYRSGDERARGRRAGSPATRRQKNGVGPASDSGTRRRGSKKFFRPLRRQVVR